MIAELAQQLEAGHGGIIPVCFGPNLSFLYRLHFIALCIGLVNCTSLDGDCFVANTLAREGASQ